jgi:hypothetical protein
MCAGHGPWLVIRKLKRGCGSPLHWHHSKQEAGKRASGERQPSSTGFRASNAVTKKCGYDDNQYQILQMRMTDHVSRTATN